MADGVVAPVGGDGGGVVGVVADSVGGHSVAVAAVAQDRPGVSQGRKPVAVGDDGGSVGDSGVVQGSSARGESGVI